tara:strand:+ start:106 stop:318 length:213 start_codon:yes stop_codon:yes gene_type:complete
MANSNDLQTAARNSMHPVEQALIMFDEAVERTLKEITDQNRGLDRAPGIKGRTSTPKQPPYNPLGTPGAI